MMEYISLSEKAYSIYSVTDKEHDNVSKETRTHTHTYTKKQKTNLKYIKTFHCTKIYRFDSIFHVKKD